MREKLFFGEEENKMATCESNQILVLDGNDVSRKDLCDLLRMLGISEDCLVCCLTIEEALDVLETNLVGLVIVEASDAIEQGYSICSLLESKYNTKVILKASLGELGPIRNAAVKVHGIISKPVELEELKYFVGMAFKMRSISQRLDEIVLKMSPSNLKEETVICDDCTFIK